MASIKAYFSKTIDSASLKDKGDRNKYMKVVIEELLAFGVSTPIQAVAKSRKRFSRRLVEQKKFSVFGKELEVQNTVKIQTAQSKEAYVPRFLHDCITYLERDSRTETDGLFRKAGSIIRQKNAKEQVNDGKSFEEAISSTSLQALDVACLMKQFFRELPTPLLTHQLSKKFLDCSKLKENAEIAVVLLTSLLPVAHLHTLRYFIKFLVQVAENEYKTQMGRNSLAVVVAPNLFASSATTCSESVLKDQPSVLKILMANEKSIGHLPEAMFKKSLLVAEAEESLHTPAKKRPNSFSNMLKCLSDKLTPKKMKRSAAVPPDHEDVGSAKLRKEAPASQPFSYSTTPKIDFACSSSSSADMSEARVFTAKAQPENVPLSQPRHRAFAKSWLQRQCGRNTRKAKPKDSFIMAAKSDIKWDRRQQLEKPGRSEMKRELIEEQVARCTAGLKNRMDAYKVQLKFDQDWDSKVVKDENENRKVKLLRACQVPEQEVIAAELPVSHNQLAAIQDVAPASQQDQGKQLLVSPPPLQHPVFQSQVERDGYEESYKVGCDYMSPAVSVTTTSTSDVFEDSVFTISTPSNSQVESLSSLSSESCFQHKTSSSSSSKENESSNTPATAKLVCAKPHRVSFLNRQPNKLLRSASDSHLMVVANLHNIPPVTNFLQQ